jgi:hypothetical protein
MKQKSGAGQPEGQRDEIVLQEQCRPGQRHRGPQSIADQGPDLDRGSRQKS